MLHRDAAERIHRVEDAYTNWYIAEDGDGLTIVDAGLPASWKSLHAALRELGRSPADIRALVLTHGHFDHVGFAERARTELGITVLVPEGEQHLARNPWDYDHERSRVRNTLEHPGWLKVFAAMGAAGALWVKGCEEFVTYAGGERLDVPGRPVAVATPGHTYGHCALHFPDRGALVAGDAIVTFDPYTLRTGPQIVSPAATADTRRALSSLDALAATGAERVLTGHGPVWEQGAAAAAERARDRPARG